jgi:hypothetical protein
MDNYQHLIFGEPIHDEDLPDSEGGDKNSGNMAQPEPI